MARPKSARKFSDTERKAALELAARIGTSAAERELGLGAKMIFKWRRMMPEYWAKLMEGDPVAQQQGVAKRLDQLAADYMETEEEAIGRAQQLLAGDDLDAKEVAALIKAMGSSRAVAASGARAIRGDDTPTLNVNINFERLEQAAEALLKRGAVDSTVEDAPQLEPGDD